jgi:hypothetical protein
MHSDMRHFPIATPANHFDENAWLLSNKKCDSRKLGSFASRGDASQRADPPFGEARQCAAPIVLLSVGGGEEE